MAFSSSSLCSSLRIQYHGSCTRTVPWFLQQFTFGFFTLVKARDLPGLPPGFLMCTGSHGLASLRVSLLFGALGKCSFSLFSLLLSLLYHLAPYKSLAGPSMLRAGLTMFLTPGQAVGPGGAVVLSGLCGPQPGSELVHGRAGQAS